MPQIDMSRFKPVTAKATGTCSVSISIINTPDHGRRINISKSALNSLMNPETVQIAYSEDALVLASELEGNPNRFTVKNGCLYASNLVIELTNHFGLDFSEGRTSHTFAGEAVKVDAGTCILLFRIK